jgi:CRP/FNR family transcriptional regulator, cyclic AMP receptor protein
MIVCRHAPPLRFDLARSAVLRVCTPEQLDEMAAAAQVYERPRGYRIADATEPFPYLGFVIDGIVGVAVTTDGPIRAVRRLLLYYAPSGATFGEACVIERSYALGEISVLSKSANYALIPAERIAAIARRNHALLRRLARVMAGRCRQLATRIARQHAWPVSARVARVLLPFTPDAPGLSRTKPQLTELTQRDIAAAAGCATEAAARAIARLEKEGALRREHGHIRYADRARLLAHFDDKNLTHVKYPLNRVSTWEFNSHRAKNCAKSQRTM